MNNTQNMAGGTPPPSTPQAMPPSQPMAMGGINPPMPPMANGGMTPPPMNPKYEDGGEMSGGKKNPLKDMFSDINLVEAGIMALGIAAFLYAIYYYKFEMELSKTGYADLNARTLKLESDNDKRKKAEANANASGKLKPKRRGVIL